MAARTTSIMDLRIGQVDAPFQTDSREGYVQKSGGFRLIENFIPTGPSLQVRRSTFYKEQVEDMPGGLAGPQGVAGPRYFRFVPFVFFKFPTGDVFKFQEKRWTKYRIIFYLYLRQRNSVYDIVMQASIWGSNRTVYTDLNVGYHNEGTSGPATNTLIVFDSSDFTIDPDNLDLSAWQIQQKDQTLYILTNKGEFRKVTISLEQADPPDPGAAQQTPQLLAKTRLARNVEVFPVEESNRPTGPNIATAYYSVPFQFLPDIQNAARTPPDGGSFNDRTTANQRNILNNNSITERQPSGMGTWSLDAPGDGGGGDGNSGVPLPSKFLGTFENRDLVSLQKQEIHYQCTYVDEDGFESDPGNTIKIRTDSIDGFPLYDTTLSPFKISEAGQEFHGNASLESQTFPSGVANEAAFGGSSGLVIKGSSINRLLLPRRINRHETAGEYQGMFNGVVQTRKRGYNGIFNWGDRSGWRWETTMNTVHHFLWYRKFFHAGNKGVMPGTVFPHFNVNEFQQSEQLYYHFVLNVAQLKSTLNGKKVKFINIYKKVFPEGSSETGFNFFLFKVLRIPDTVISRPEDALSSAGWFTDGGTYDAEAAQGDPKTNYPYFFQDHGEPLDFNVSAGTRIYNLGEGKPRAMAFHEQRLFLGNFENFPMLIRGSDLKSEDFRERQPVQADDALDFRPHALDGRHIKFLMALRELVLFTDESVMTIQAREGIAAGAFSVVERSPYPIGDLPPLQVEESVLFFEDGGKNLRDYLFNWQSDNFRGDDLAVFVKSLFEKYKISSWTFERDPYPIVWCVREDGVLLSLTYRKDLEAFAWAQHKFADGDFKVRAVKSIYIREQDTDNPGSFPPQQRRQWLTYFFGEDRNGKPQTMLLSPDFDEIENSYLDFQVDRTVQEDSRGKYVDLPADYRNILIKINSGKLDFSDVIVGAFTEQGELVTSPVRLKEGFEKAGIDQTVYVQDNDGNWSLDFSPPTRWRLKITKEAAVGETLKVGVLIEGTIRSFSLLSTFSFYQRFFDDTLKISSINLDVVKSLPFLAGTDETNLVEQGVPVDETTGFYSGPRTLKVPSGFKRDQAFIVKNKPGLRLECSGIQVITI